jgi:hypothetical protein
VVISERGSDCHYLSDALHWCPDIVSNEQESLHLTRQVLGAKKLVREPKIHLGSWNINLIELVNIAIRRCMNILYIQKTKWTGQKAKEVENYSDKNFIFFLLHFSFAYG